MDVQAIVKAVREYCYEHYEEGFDLVIETYNQVQIEVLAKRLGSAERVIAHLAPVAREWKEQRDEVESFAF